MLTSFALNVWSNKIIDVDIILSITLTVSQNLLIRFYHGDNLREIGAFLYLCILFQP